MEASRAVASPVQVRTYEQWLRGVDVRVQALAGVGLDDLPDVDTRDWFEAGMSPRAAALEALRNAAEEYGFDPEELGL